MDLADFSKAYLMDGRAATIRALFVIAPVVLSCGTLKSHLKNKRMYGCLQACQSYLIKTRFPAKSKLSIDTFFNAIFNLNPGKSSVQEGYRYTERQERSKESLRQV